MGTAPSWLYRLSTLRNRRIAFIVLAFIAWSAVCWVWYVCGIRNLCTTKDTSPAPSIVIAE